MIRRASFGISVGATIVAIALTPWGKQSGGHLNPAMTFAYYRLGIVKLWDGIFYGLAQFVGATAGVTIATSLLLGAPGNPTIRYAATLPGIYGAGGAFIAEVVISFTLMLTVLFTSNHNILRRYTPYFVGALYAIFITLETPLSGMSMNPARTFDSAATGMPFGSTSSPRLWACWLLQKFSRGCTVASAPTAQSSITTMTSAVYSASARSAFDRKETVKEQPLEPPGIGLQTVAVWRVWA